MCMEKDVIIGITILILAVLLLGITYTVNAADLFRFLDKPLEGDGLSLLCSSLSDCQDFCQKNMGRCTSYCQANPANKICDLITANDFENETK